MPNVLATANRYDAVLEQEWAAPVLGPIVDAIAEDILRDTKPLETSSGCSPGGAYGMFRRVYHDEHYLMAYLLVKAVLQPLLKPRRLTATKVTELATRVGCCLYGETALRVQMLPDWRAANYDALVLLGVAIHRAAHKKAGSYTVGQHIKYLKRGKRALLSGALRPENQKAFLWLGKSLFTDYTETVGLGRLVVFSNDSTPYRRLEGTAALRGDVREALYRAVHEYYTRCYTSGPAVPLTRSGGKTPTAARMVVVPNEHRRLTVPLGDRTSQSMQQELEANESIKFALNKELFELMQLYDPTEEIASTLAWDGAVSWPIRIDFLGRTISPLNRMLDAGLLWRAEQSPMCNDGMRALCGHLVHTYTGENPTPSEADKWLRDYSAAVEAVATAPRSLTGFWHRAKHPYPFVAACMEWERATKTRTARLPIPVPMPKAPEYLAPIPELLECNIGALMLDMETLRHSDTWTTGLGLPPFTLADVREALERWADDAVPVSCYAWEALRLANPRLRGVTLTLFEYAWRSMTLDEPLVWRLPDGFVVVQDYGKAGVLVVDHMTRDYPLSMAYFAQNVHDRRQLTEFPPNFIRSLAAHAVREGNQKLDRETMIPYTSQTGDVGAWAVAPLVPEATRALQNATQTAYGLRRGQLDDNTPAIICGGQS